jgi:hypothetical protein
MDLDIATAPPSPGFEELLSMFTTLRDDDKLDLAVDDALASPLDYAGLFLRRRSSVQTSKVRKQGVTKKIRRKPVPGYICFSSVSGETVTNPGRSAFSKERRDEVNTVRKGGACLRCRIRKMPVRSRFPCLTLALLRLESAQTRILAKHA